MALAGEGYSPKPKFKVQLAAGSSAATVGAIAPSAPAKLLSADTSATDIANTSESGTAARLGLTVRAIEPNLTASWYDVKVRSREMEKLIESLPGGRMAEARRRLKADIKETQVAIEPNLTASWDDVKVRNCEMERLIESLPGGRRAETRRRLKTDAKEQQVPKTIKAAPVGSISLQAVGEDAQQNLAQLSKSAGPELWALLAETETSIAELRPADSATATDGLKINDEDVQRQMAETQVDSVDTLAVDGSVRLAALNVVAQLAATGGEHAVSLLAARVVDADEDIRRAAVESLALLAEKGDENAISAIVGRLEDSDRDDEKDVSMLERNGHVHYTAVKALGRVAKRGDERALAVVIAQLEHTDWDVRRAAVQSLAQLSEKGDERIISMVATRLEDVKAYVRSAAATAITQLAEKGNERAISIVAARAKHWDWFVRQTAVDTLGKLSVRGILPVLPTPAAGTAPLFFPKSFSASRGD